MFYLCCCSLSVIVVWSLSHTGATFYNNMQICHMVIFLF